MTKFYVIHRKHLILTLGIAILAAAAILYFQRNELRAATGAMREERVIHLVTGEFNATMPDGTKLEAYRWDPGTIYVDKGEKVKLSIRGVNGASHPFIIEGTQIKGEVKQGKETIVPLQIEKEGVYRIICLTHPDMNHNGPMIGYIVVD
ncbi:cupredoxin domain-containing protein [Paenibacillus koleovorans]|uniref:cupredoxin domain-containing protein n=1 Tax=Paenibacillus koleovorans TaxID=121608 RepID=UPI000FDC14AC|nr:cupredoxin domain-containing protein [Paenibacillus koleovorans]